MASEPPVLPDGDVGRRWAEEELAKADYQRPAARWLEEGWQRILDWFGQLEGPSAPSSPVALALIVAAGVVIILAAVVLVRPRLNARRKAQKEMYDAGTSESAEGYRQRAAAAAAAGNLRAAVVDQFRALVKAAEEDEVIDARAGRTADEAAAELGLAYPLFAARLRHVAALFDSVLYGLSGAAPDDYAAVSDLDEDLRKEVALRAEPEQLAAPGAQAPL
ncbi:DUF4129 domain-containing protein [Pseudarthrobacter sp. J75]|uniref:DUF4129 domain-containing protein n=1 Tax=unclassified Pseudarthrobacter TaxID=2647000 RepID=UPI002E801A5B|nr:MULTISPECIES: DUF4129 domain-containing protein [unclassified Pseudarthrobacter]MEE2521367.1 DUF4129 domain-containing protein [Pseudarthrobacter sp. J47]MEE2528599.1 DUF4129 domain-containing protein [Pseudarthrobacter sp. J75]